MIDRKGKIAFIRAAVDSDVDRIHEIATEQSAKINHTSGAIEGTGLVSGYDKETYRRSVNSASYFFVLVQDGTITSFMLAFDCRDAAPVEIKLEEVRQLISERDIHPVSDSEGQLKFVLIKQICTAKNFTRHGHARMLYQALKTLRRSSPLYAAIVVSPPNVSSICLHEDAGFIRTFEFKDKDDGFKRAFWRCSRIDERETPDLLTHQHEVAADLYKHEDDLNWKKLSALFYISGALLAGIGVLLRPTDSSQIPRNLVFFIAFCIGLLGFAMSLFFLAALRSGVDYMLHRKQTLIDIDGEIAKLNGIRMFVPVAISRTAKYLKLISLAPSIFWLIVIGSIFYYWK